MKEVFIKDVRFGDCIPYPSPTKPSILCYGLHGKEDDLQLMMNTLIAENAKYYVKLKQPNRRIYILFSR